MPWSRKRAALAPCRACRPGPGPDAEGFGFGFGFAEEGLNLNLRPEAEAERERGRRACCDGLFPVSFLSVLWLFPFFFVLFFFEERRLSEGRERKRFDRLMFDCEELNQ